MTNQDSEPLEPGAAAGPAGFTLEEVGRLVLVPFRGVGALPGWGLGVLVAVVPFIGGLALAGYQIRIMRDAVEAELASIPRWNRLVELCGDGARVVLADLGLVTIPTFLLRLVVSPPGPGAAPAPSWMVIIPFVLRVVLLPPALLAIATHRFGDAFDVPAHLRRIQRHLRLFVPLMALIAAQYLVVLTIARTAGIRPPGLGVTVPEDAASLGGSLVYGAAVFWTSALAAALVGTAGRKMGIRPAAAGTGPLRILGR